MSVRPPEALKQIARQLYGWRGRELLGATDVLVWVRRPGEEYGRYGLAFQGDALRMQQRAIERPLANPQGTLDLALQRALGLPAEVRSYGGRTYPAHQTMDEGNAYVSVVLDGVDSLVSEKLGEEAVVESTLMPREGSPWSPQNSPTPYFSAKHGDQQTEKPKWLVEVETREGPALGADFCAFAPRITHCTSGAVVGSFWSNQHPGFLVTHASGVFDRGTQAEIASKARATGDLIRRCGGLLFPSLAISEVPATNYGELVFVADVSLILPALRPYKKRGRWPVVVYETDVWTETTHAFLGDAAAELLTELTDIPNFMYKRSFWVLGPPVMQDVRPPVGSTKRLRTALAKRARLYKRALNEQGLELIRQSLPAEHVAWYGYLEAKVNGITSMDCYPLAVCPKGETRRVRAFLKRIGFAGELLTVGRPPAIEGRDPRWDYAWRVRDKVLEYAGVDADRLLLKLEG